MSVYIDPRKTKEVKQEEVEAPRTEEWMAKIEKMDNEELGRKIAAGLGYLLISPLVFMLLWNCICYYQFCNIYNPSHDKYLYH